MTVKLIGIFHEKLDNSDEKEVFTQYNFECVLTKDDFDNGTNEGYESFFKTREDAKDFLINGEEHSLPYNEEDSCDHLSKEQIEILDSLEEGDVVVFDADLYIEYNYDGKRLISIFSTIDNIEKYDDKYAADEIRLIVSKLPSIYD